MPEPLTKLQRQLAFRVQQGDDLNELSSRFNLSPRQVRRHIEVMRLKLPDYPGPARARIVQWAVAQKQESR